MDLFAFCGGLSLYCCHIVTIVNWIDIMPCHAKEKEKLCYGGCYVTFAGYGIWMANCRGYFCWVLWMIFDQIQRLG